MYFFVYNHVVIKITWKTVAAIIVKLLQQKFHYRPVSSYLVYIVHVIFFFYRVLLCVTFILVYGMSVSLPFACYCNSSGIMP